jgi:hypothetical protein
MSDARSEYAPELFLEAFPKLDDRGRRVFTETLQELQSHSYVMRGGALRINPLYAFIEKHEDLVNAYLTIGGWRLHLDKEQGVARIYHPESHGRVRFNKGETTLILMLRLIYHEKKRSASEEINPVITIGLLRERLNALLPQVSVKPFLSRKILGSWLRNLESYRIIAFEGLSHTIQEETKIKLYPVLEHLVTQNSLTELNAVIRERITGLHGTSSETEAPDAEEPLQ